MDTKRIEVSLSEDRINLTNGSYQKELKYWKDAALKMALDEDKALKESAHSSFLKIRLYLANGYHLQGRHLDAIN